MKIRDISKFRTWFKTDHRQKNDPNIDENFVGCEHIDIGEKKTFGFYELYHGYKPNIANDLMDGLKNAQDGQAIYEFIQNAADSKSTYFGIFYNEDYFLAINNGSPFSQTDLISILNANQSSKTNEQGQAIDCEKIGRFGIGFKLVHRLVGENDGMQELTEKYKGPIVYSWSNHQIRDLLDTVKNQTLSFDENAPLLFKILITNFPTYPDETVKDIQFNERTLFTNEEYKEFVNYFNEISAKLDISQLKEGSIFFLKLGKNKKKLLDDQNKSLMNGVKVGLNYLKTLNSITICNNNIKKLPLNLIEFTSKPADIINPEDPFCDIKTTFGYLSDYKEGMEELRASSNFYKYFPMSRENHGLNFVLHSTAFRIKTDRTQFEEDIDNTNTSIFQKFWKDFEERLKEIKSNNPNEFNNIYANLLISKPLLDDNGNKKWFYESFYTPLLNFLKGNIPTKNNNFSDNPQNVKIKKFDFDISLSDLGLSDIHWFYWKEDEDQYLLNEATSNEKIGIEEWSLRDVFINADLDCLNDWIKGLPQKDYDNFLKELDKEYFSKDAIERLLETELFKFSDGQFYSINEVSNNEDLIFLSNKVVSIQEELKSLDFSISDLDISAFSFYDKVSSKLKSDEDLYDTISERTSTENNLTVNQKQNLFRNFINPATKFIGIGDETLKKLELFCDNQGEIKPLFQLVNSSLKNYTWLNPYKIKADENFEKLSNYLIQEEDLFDKIILPNIEIIKEELTEAKEIKELVTFFKENHRSFFNEYIIQKRTNDYEIIDKSDKFQIIPPRDERNTFIDFIETYLSDKLIVLPYDFSDFNDQDGILKGEKLHSQILELVDVDEHKETLVDFIHYNESKRKFLQKLTEFRFNSETNYTKEDYEFKILDLACSELKENDYSTFKDKITIQTEEQDLALSQIPSSADRIVIDHKELSQSQILPNEAKNGKVLSDLLEQFITIGLQKEQLYKLFGIQSGNDPKQVYEILKQEYDVLENTEQLAFVLLYAKEFDENIENFKVETLDDKEWELKYNYYTKTLSFIGEDYLLKPQYSDVSKIIHLPIAICNSENKILQQPYFSENNFICPSLKSDLSEEEKLALTDFLYSEWKKDTNKQKVQSIDWSKINDTETNTVLGFTPNHSVFPNQYACDNEQLPDYLIKWIGKDENRIDFISDLGVWTERTVIVELRKFLQGEITEFHNNRLAQETRFNDDETNLFNTFEWLKENEIKLETAEQFETFKKVVGIINESRINKGALVIPDKDEEKYDFGLLNELSTKWEKEIENYSIYLYNGKMPVIVRLDEIDDYMFYSYPEGDYVVNENRIYINDTVDRNNVLMQVATYLKDNDFTVSLFGSQNNTDEIEKLREENKKLKDEKAKDNQKESGNETENPNSSFLDEVNDFIAELEETDWNNYVPELKNLLLDFNNQPEEKRKLFNLIAKIKLTKEKNVKFEESDEGYNVVKIRDEKYFVHSARGAFAYIHPSELLKMKSDGYRMGIDFGKKFKIYENSEDIFELNKVHLLAYQSQNTTEDLLSFCQSNRDANKRLLIIDKDNASEKSRALLKLLNIEDDYQ